MLRHPLPTLALCIGLVSLATADLDASITVAPQAPGAPSATVADTGRRSSMDILSTPAGLEVQSVTLEEALRTLYDTAKIPLIFSPTYLPSTLVTCRCQDVSVGEALETLLDRTGLRVTVLENQVVVYPGEAPETRASARRIPGTLAALIPSPVATFDPSGLAPLQQVTGVIRGMVRDQANGEPLAAAQVFIAALDQGVLTQSSGQYSMTNVPPGTHEVSVILIGYRTATSMVTVASGATVVHDVSLQTQALQLDEIVVTGTAGGSRIREVGNAVSRLDAAIATTQPVENVSDLLRGRVAGVSIQQGSGGVGTASTIKIRGSSTMRLVNDGPLIYIDGVRVSNEMTSGPSDVSRIDDLDPASIESIEVIKGPAAATLYGTEAANGIIQIITKAGRPGAPQWDFTMRQGANWFADPAEHSPTNWGVNPLTGDVETLNILENPAERDRMFRTGRDQSYGADVSGGSAEFRYYLSASTSKEEGATFNSEASKHNGRVNVTAQPTPSLTVAANAGFALTRIRLPSQFPYRDAVYATPAHLDGPRRGYRAAPPEVRYEQDDDRNDANRITSGVTLTHTPTDWLTHRLTFGLDITDQTVTNLDNVLTPQSAQFFSARAASGSKSVTQQSQFFTTFDYSASATRALSESISSTSSVGFQVYTKSLRSITAGGTGFPSLGLTSVSATGERTSSDNLVENNTAGVYAQQQFGLRDRLFVTGAVRADDNSAFGESFDVVLYPKVSASWVASEEPFWGLDFINAFRLRAAYGQSGQQPDAFDALRSYVTRADPDGTATLRPDTPGNPDLGPERGVEIEAGFDAEFFGGRVALDVTFYDKRTKDAIVARNVAPSAGFSGQEFVNIGEVSNRGMELALGARVIDASRLHWDVDLNLSTNRNRVEELGLDGFLQLGWTSRHTEGYPVGSLWAPTVIQATLDSDGVVRDYQCDDGNGQPVACDEDSWIYQGQPDPSLEGSFATSVTLGDRLTLSAMAQGKIGQSKYDLQAWYRYSAYQQTELNYFPERFDPRDVAAAQYGNSGEFSLWVNESSFVRLRELSLTYRVPIGLLDRVGASQGTISIAARNLGMIWTNWPTYPYHDPEVVDPSSTFSGNREPQADASIPPLTSVAVTLRLSM